MSKKNKQTEGTTVPVLDITGLNGSFVLIIRYLNKACEAGLFDMDKAYELKLACNDIIKGINTLNSFQQFYINQTNEIEKQRVTSIEKRAVFLEKTKLKQNTQQKVQEITKL